MRLLTIIVLIATASAASAATTTTKFSFGRFGTATIYKPQVVRHAALFFSGEHGWSANDAALASALAEQGVLVAGIDYQHYAAELSKPRSKCAYLAGEFEDFSHELQKNFSPDRYHLPLLIGVGAGASLVYAIAAQGSSGTFVGTLTLGFHPRWQPPLKLCQSYELKYSADEQGYATLQPSIKLSTPWIDVHADGDRNWSTPDQRRFVSVVGTAQVTIVMAGDLVAENAIQWSAAAVANANKLLAADHEQKVLADELRDLPLEEVRASGTATTRMALFLTGDGGWAAIDKGISAQLAARGIDVVALSSLQYFWKPRSPDQTAGDVARVLRHYLANWRKREVIVVGYSFGADIAAFVVNRLPEDLRSRIASVNLLGLGSTADFEVHVSTWLGVDHHGLPTVPEIERLDVPVLCVFGEGETDTACNLPKNSRVHVVKIGDGHHFGDRYRDLSDAIVRTATQSVAR